MQVKLCTRWKPVISYNNRHSAVRQNFTLAHEIGHFILHSKDKPLFIDKSDKVMYRNNASSTGELRKEREANAFAASLLMPECLIKQELSDTPHEGEIAIDYLSEKFQASSQAMTFRLSNLGFYVGY